MVDTPQFSVCRAASREALAVVSGSHPLPLVEALRVLALQHQADPLLFRPEGENAAMTHEETPLSAVRIGLVPRLALPRIVSAGNVAGEGAKIAALSLRERAEAQAMLREVEYVELSGRSDFNDLFIDQLAFPG